MADAPGHPPNIFPMSTVLLDIITIRSHRQHQVLSKHLQWATKQVFFNSSGYIL